MHISSARAKRSNAWRIIFTTLYAYERRLPWRRIQVRGSCFAIRNIQDWSRTVYQGHVMHINVEWAPSSWTGARVYYDTLRERVEANVKVRMFFKMLVEQWCPRVSRVYGVTVPLHICKSRLCVRYAYECMRRAR